jgi:single-stranded-DNA-specific exonuclease
VPLTREELAEEGPDWPADAAAVAQARSLLRLAARTQTVVACDSDVDGLAAAVIVERALTTLGGAPHVFPAPRGEHVHHSNMLRRLDALRPSCLIVVDMGSRPQPILPGTPTLIVDHHHAAAGVPPGAVVVNGYDRQPVAPSSVLAHVVCRTVPGDDSRAWLAALGAIADLGSAAPFRPVLGIRAGGHRWTRAAALLNAARRADPPDAAVALELLRHASSVDDVTSGAFPETRVLEQYQQQVRAEVDRCARVPPVITDNVALIRFSSGAQVHPIVATRWSHRLQPRIVLAANDGYLAGRTNFSVRCRADIDLVAWLHSLSFAPSPDAEYANGHARATGGSLSTHDFTALLDVLGFPQTAGQSPAR